MDCLHSLELELGAMSLHSQISGGIVDAVWKKNYELHHTLLQVFYGINPSYWESWLAELSA